METIKIILEGDMVPKFYGTSYREWNTAHSVCHPSALNHLVSIKQENSDLKHELKRTQQARDHWYRNYLSLRNDKLLTDVESIYWCDCLGTFI